MARQEKIFCDRCEKECSTYSGVIQSFPSDHRGFFLCTKCQSDFKSFIGQSKGTHIDHMKIPGW